MLDLAGQWQRSAAEDVENLERSWFSSSGLAEQLDKITAKYTGFPVATLNKDRIHAERREAQLLVNDYGQQIWVKESVLEVAIPFTGSADSFEIQPSTAALIYADCSVRDGELVVTVPDDDNTQRAVDEFVKDVTKTLDQLRREVEAAAGPVRQAVQTAGDQRQRRIKAEEERDAKLSFPVR
jgi:hypothetical protein